MRNFTSENQKKNEIYGLTWFRTESPTHLIMLCTILGDRLTKIKKEQLGGIYIYHKKCTYFTKLNRRDLNKELTWNEAAFTFLEDALCNRNKFTFVNLFEDKKQIVFGYEIQRTEMKVILFQKQILNLFEDPFKHCIQMISSCRSHYQKIRSECDDIEKEEKQTILKVESFKKQCKDKNQFILGMIKEKFIKFINPLKFRIKSTTKIYVQDLSQVEQSPICQKQTEILVTEEKKQAEKPINEESFFQLFQN